MDRTREGNAVRTQFSQSKKMQGVLTALAFEETLEPGYRLKS